MQRASQTERVYHYMHTFGSINPMQALSDLSVMRLASRITDLKRSGCRIGKRTCTARNRFGEQVHFAEYYLLGAHKDDEQ